MVSSGLRFSSLVPVAAAAVGCHEVDYSQTTFKCDLTHECPEGQSCVGGWCNGDGGGPDAGADAVIVDCMDWPAPAHFDPCAIGPVPATGLGLNVTGEYVYDTTTGSLTDPGGQDVPAPATLVVDGSRLISVASLTIAGGSRLRVIGDKPLIVASWSTIDVMGMIDASSSVLDGAGANPAGCSSHAGIPGTSGLNGSGGGGGGGFQGNGGSGGRGDADQTMVPGGNGGTAISAPLFVVLGGCPGAAGGNGGAAGGAGSSGGGAIQLTARSAITISGTVHAGGAGGRGAALAANNPDRGGAGGGGGSGGMIGLEAPVITMTGTLAANGGGGGEAADNSPGEPAGEPGQDATADQTPAPGGVGVGVAGNGGPGSAGGTLIGGTGTDDDTDGGGGGGGGAGYILVRSPDQTLGGIRSPPATTVP